MQERIYNFIFKKNIFYISIILCFILFKTPIENIISETFVKYLFSYVESNWTTDMIMLVIIILLINYTKYNYRKIIPSKNIQNLTTLLSIIYIYYRISGKVWAFTSVYTLHFLKYSDILILLTLFQLLLRRKQKSIVQKTNSKFLIDLPISNFADDKLGYGKYASEIADRINKSNFEKSFAIGINGKWGMGKTSFINLIKSEVDQDNIIEINFNPWNSQSSKAIVIDFFDTLQEKLGPYHYSLAKQLKKYSSKLIEVNNNTITQSIQTAIFTLTGFESTLSLHSGIDETLKNINKKIVIYIDDLDRLDSEEIIEIIRLIRNTANFNNTFFIVAYDRNYIINALNNYNLYKGDVFLEKIFQIEVTLPYFKKDILRKCLADSLTLRLPIEYKEIINYDILGNYYITPRYLNKWLDNMRDVTRLSNTILLNIEKLKGDVVFNDFLRIELLRLKYPSVYESLHRHRSDFLDNSTIMTKVYRYQLKLTNNSNNTNLSKEELVNKTVFGEYLTSNKEQLMIDSTDILKIVDLVDDIFYRGYYRNSHNSHLSITIPSKFERYFKYSLNDNNLSEVEFSKYRALSLSEFNTKIEDWVRKGLGEELVERFKQINEYDNNEDFEKIISAIFHLANQTNENLSSYVSYDGSDLYSKLNNYEDALSKKYYSGDKKSLEIFVRNIFESAKYPFRFEAEFIFMLKDSFLENFPLSIEELNDSTISYFEKYCEITEKIDDNFWNLYHCSVIINKINSSPSAYTKERTIPEKVKSIFKDFIIKDMDNFILSVIVIEPYNNRSSLSKIILEIFNDWSSFEKTIKSLNIENSKYLEEFKRFILNLSKHQYKESIEFEFIDIPIQSKLLR